MTMDREETLEQYLCFLDMERRVVARMAGMVNESGHVFIPSRGEVYACFTPILDGRSGAEDAVKMRAAHTLSELGLLDGRLQ